jgi:hypothetical protein
MVSALTMFGLNEIPLAKLVQGGQEIINEISKEGSVLILYDGVHLEVVLGNTRHIKNVPGRKTDIADSGCLANLLHAHLRLHY